MEETMRRVLIAGNWKMHHDIVDTERVLMDIKAHFLGNSEMDVLICPSFVSLDLASRIFQDTTILLGAQTMSEYVQGAFTGEISGGMLRSVGCSYVILGHSERRVLFSETDQMVNSKLKAAHVSGLIPILCVGESLEERDAGHTLDVIGRQLTAFGRGL
jgi:triosephosphate isomerase (TIM)